MSLEKGFKEAFSVETVVSIFVAFLAYFVASLLQSYVFSKVSALATVPEVADATVLIAGAAFTSGKTQEAVIIGSGLHLLNDLAARFGIAWLRVGA
jgi:uncharacterized membrane protein affecting hemolysin expression